MRESRAFRSGFRVGLWLAGAWIVPGISPGLLSAQGPEMEMVAWDFNSELPDGNEATGTVAPAKGWGQVAQVGGVWGWFGSGQGSADPATADDSAWRLGNWPSQGAGNKQHGIELRLNATGWQPVRLEWDFHVSAGASRYWRVQYSIDGRSWVDGPVVVAAAGAWLQGVRVDLRGMPRTADNPWLALRLVSEFEATATGRGAAAYVGASSQHAYDPNGWVAMDSVRVWGIPTLAQWGVLTWNLSGFGMTNWTPTHAQLEAVVRVLRHLKPTVVSFQEVPEGWETAMTNWVKSWWPEATVVVGARTDGALRLAVASGLPVRAVRSWLRRAPLDAWGHVGVFTRELLEAEVVVPGHGEPVHVFTVHLKAGTDGESAARRAAEALAISNFFAGEWPTRRRGRAYLLAGDCNEDVNRPRPGERGAVRILVGEGTGLRLLTPVQPVTGDDRTWSSRQASLSYRFDYVLPSGLLVSNVVASGVFRSDREWPRPVGVELGDSALASDHLPVWTVFANPFLPPRLTWDVRGGKSWLRWWSGAGQRYRLEVSTDLERWTSWEELWAAGPGWMESPVEMTDVGRFYRVVRLP
ncbi:endonuclease/exonuclease/phosphatase family protein [Limisphaera sp. VF-2]|uniref:endonuclease/exonuclease/phosphatase family protein n=1 Tax=Limisphaera sp. VF-2 TaxID=3400418 RepID=UPI003C21B923